MNTCEPRHIKITNWGAVHGQQMGQSLQEERLHSRDPTWLCVDGPFLINVEMRRMLETRGWGHTLMGFVSSSGDFLICCDYRPGSASLDRG